MKNKKNEAFEMIAKATKPSTLNLEAATKKAEESKTQTISEALEKMGFVSAKNVVDKADDKLHWLVQDLITQEGMIVVAGSSAGGKSRMMTQLAMCVVSGKDFLGRQVAQMKNPRALIISTEDGIKASGVLMKKQNEDMHLTSEELQRIDFLFDSSDLLEKLAFYTRNNTPAVVIKDTFSDDFQGDMYKASEVRSYIQGFMNILQKCEVQRLDGTTCAPVLIFVHHLHKRADDMLPSKHNLLGSGGLEAKSREVLELKTCNQDEREKYLCITKANYLAPEMKEHAYVLEFSDNLTFSDTGKVIAFEQINKNAIKSKADDRKYAEIMEMRQCGTSWRKIGEHLCVSESAIRSFVERYEKKNNIIKEN